MKTKKHLLSMLLALCLMLVTMSMTAFAAPGETTPVVVIGNSDGTGIELNADTPYYVNGESTAAAAEPQNWNAYFDVQKSTLYLNGLQVEGYYQYHQSYFWTAALYTNRDLKISLNGNNVVKNSASSSETAASYYGVQLWSNDENTSGKNYSLTITSDSAGSLEASGPDTSNKSNAGIMCYDLEINGNAKVIAKAGESTGSYSHGMAAQSLTVSGDVSLEAVSSNSPTYESMGISLQRNTSSAMTVTDNAYVEARSGYSASNVNCGIYTGILTVSGNGQVKAYGDSGATKSAGIYARGGIVEIADNGSIYAAGGVARTVNSIYDGSYGIISVSPTDYFGGQTNVTGGSLTAVGQQWAVYNAADLTNYEGVYFAAASAETDGSNAGAYEPENYQDYKYLQITPHTHQWSDLWSSDETHHWHECAAENCPITDNSGKDGYEAHMYNQEIVSDTYKAGNATCTDPAKYYKSCVCGAKGTEVFSSGEPIGHEWGDPKWNWAEDYKSATVTFTCQNDGSHTESPKVAVVGETTGATCTEVGKTVYTARVTFNGRTYTDDQTVEIPATGHRAGAGWKSDGTNHWNECTECGAILNKAAHTFEWVTDKVATSTEAGSKHEECTVCGYEKTAVEIPAMGTPDSGKPVDTTSPKTGDNGIMPLYIAMFLAFVGLTGTVLYSRKRKHYQSM